MVTDNENQSILLSTVQKHNVIEGVFSRPPHQVG